MTITETNIAIINSLDSRSKQLAVRTQLPVIDKSPEKDSEIQFTLSWIDKQLSLSDHSAKKPIITTIDFTKGRTLHRLKFGGGHGQELARAVKTQDKPLVCDATAGLGKDAFVFASLGCEVVLLEQSVIVHALLEDAIQRAMADPDINTIASRMHLYHCDSTKLPDNWPHTSKPDVVYLDPMYPQGRRTAKKEIQTLRALLEDTNNEDLTGTYETALLQAARATAKRVAVKRPRKAQPLANVTPSGEITSTNTRYDIYGA